MSAWTGLTHNDAKSPSPEWLQNILGDDYFYDVEVVWIQNPDVKNVDQLALLKKLKQLYLMQTGIIDAKPLASLNQLRRLSLARTQVQNVAPLSCLTNLEHLYLNDTNVRDVTPLARLAKLNLLDVSGTKVSKEGIDELQSALPNCEISHDYWDLDEQAIKDDPGLRNAFRRMGIEIPEQE